MQMTFQPSFGINVPAGTYTARFLGTEDREPMDGSKFGKGMIPRMSWVWEVTEGPEAGKRIAQDTGTAAVPKSGAARVLLGLTGGQVQPGKSVDTNSFVGKLYQLEVAVNPDSDKGNLHVALIKPLAAGATASSPPPPPPAAGPKPPPRPPAPPRPQASRKYWAVLEEGGEPRLVEEKEFQEYIETHQLDPAELHIWENGQEYRPAKEFGFLDKIPF